MFPWLEVYRSANESSEDIEALAGESTEAPSPAPDAGQETPDENTQSVPYERFKAVNDKLAETLAKLELGDKADPVPEKAAPGLTADDVKAIMKDVMKDSDFKGVAQEVKQLRVERKRVEIFTELRKFPQFNEARDVPRIKARMEAALANGEKLGALSAFKNLLVEGPPETPDVAHDAKGTTTGADKAGKGPTPHGHGALQREHAATAQFKNIFEKDPKMRRALELDD